MSDLEKIGRYKIKGVIDRGGMATVYQAYDPRFRRDVAIKVLPREFLDKPTMRARFEREARTIAGLEHPAIVPVHDFGEEDGQPYLVMRLMTGGTLAARLQKGPLPPSEAAQILERMGSALDEAHKQNVIHRDLKPGNILFDKFGDAYLSDFGIVRVTTSQTDLTGAGSLGTPGYMSPEQIQGEEVDGRTDIYALGVIAFEMLTGKPPFVADSPAMVLIKQMTEPLPRIGKIMPDLSSDYDDVFERTLSKEPTERPATASELTALLVAAAQASKQAADLLAAAVQPTGRLEPDVSKPTAASDVPTTIEPPESGASMEITTPISPVEQLKSKHRRPITRWLPGAVVLFVMVLFGLFVLNLLNHRNGQALGQATATGQPEMTANSTQTGEPTPSPTALPQSSPVPTTPPLPGTGTVPLANLAPEIPWLPLGEQGVPTTYSYLFNVNIAPFDDPLVRQAFALSVDRQTVSNLALDFDYNQPRPATTFAHPDTLGRDLYREVGLPYEPERARLLLAQAGYPDGANFPSVTLAVDASPASEAIAIEIIAMWNNVLGVPVTLVQIDDFSAYIAYLEEEQPALFRLGWAVDMNDPDNTLNEIFHSGHPFNYGQFANEDYDAVVEEAAAAAGDPAMRQVLYIQAERILCEEEAAVIPLFH
ncbi:MAG: protein kinase, partial [Candidatus Promineifilaceae bacterium]